VSDADAIIALLDLVPHPEGGFFRETWRDDASGTGRAAGSAIYYLLAAGDRSAWHRIDATEVWHHYAGAPLELRVVDGDADEPRRFLLGPDLATGQQPQLVVPAGAWQSAVSLGAWTLVGCTVSPAFEAAGFELAPEGLAAEGWRPGGGQ
jgi:hypothetical protein